MSKRMTRREMLKLAGALGAGSLLAACAPTPEVIEKVVKETVEVEKVVKETVEVEKVVEKEVEKVVTPTPPPPEPADIVIMYQENELTDENVEQFNADYAPITLTRVEVDFTRYYAMYAAGNPPDLLRTMAANIPQMVGRNIPLNLQPYFDASSVLVEDDMMPVNDYYKANSPLDIGSGPRYGMAKDWAPDGFIWVNDTVFEAAGVEAPDPASMPISGEALADLARAATTQEGGKYVTTGLGTHTPFIDRFWRVLTKAAGGSMFSDDFQQANFVGNDAFTNAVRYYHDLTADGAFQGPVNPTADWFGGDFIAGRLAMVQTGYWFHGTVTTAEDEAFNQAIADGKIHMYPMFTWQGTRYDPCFTACGAIISASTKAPDAAWTVFEWFMGKEPAEGRASGGWGLPSLQSLFELVPKEGPMSAAAYETVQEELEYAKDILHYNPYLPGLEPGVAGAVYLENLGGPGRRHNLRRVVGEDGVRDKHRHRRGYGAHPGRVTTFSGRMEARASLRPCFHDCHKIERLERYGYRCNKCIVSTRGSALSPAASIFPKDAKDDRFLPIHRSLAAWLHIPDSSSTTCRSWRIHDQLRRPQPGYDEVPWPEELHPYLSR